MNLQQLRSLGLEKRWPKLAKHLQEIAGLEVRVRESESQVAQMRAALPHAEQKDLDTAAAAIRNGEELPRATNTDSAKRQLDDAERTYTIMERALVSAQADLSAFMADHQGALYQDVAQARAEIGSKAAEAAEEALSAYGRYEDLKYLVRSLQPPPPQPDHNQPAQRLTQVVANMATTRSSGPDRGTVESTLQHIIALGDGPEEGENAA